MYAALAYDPSQSCFFRVVRFYDDQGSRSLNVYNSETKGWKNLKFRLENNVAKAEWTKHSLFFQGAMYRASMSGNLLKFVFNKEVSLNHQAQAMDLPEVIAKKLCSKQCYSCLGLSNDRINFMAFDEELNLCILVLITNTNEWSLRCRLSKIHEKYKFENNFVRPLAFHPYLDIIFVGSNFRASEELKSAVIRIDFGKDIAPPSGEEYVYMASLYERSKDHIISWRNAITFPVLKCPIPFASGLVDNPADRMYHNLRIPFLF
ncbi:hypothetical protein TorRG33x02_063770 [Trema orientale]|uniref:Uncharacterized protein n=1 Tax=Trema orientale TaxID=63057 RepID=A0A2P5FJ38_TREOI|nr:hypothetical protein TorRG33x02_063770 [Trema orientale]